MAVKSESVKNTLKSVFLAKVVLPSNAESTAFCMTLELPIALVITSSSICATSPFAANFSFNLASNSSAVISVGLTNLEPNFVSKASAVISFFVATCNVAFESFDTIPRFFKSDTINSLTASSSVPTSPLAANFSFNLASNSSAVISSLVATFNLFSSALSTIPRFFKSDTINSLTASSSVPTSPLAANFSFNLASNSSAVISVGLTNLEPNFVSKASAVISFFVATCNVAFESFDTIPRFFKSDTINSLTASSSVPTSSFAANFSFNLASNSSAVISVGLTNLEPNFVSKASAVISFFVATCNVAFESFDTIPRFFKSDTINSLTASSSVPTSPFAANFSFNLASNSSAVISVGLTNLEPNFVSKASAVIWVGLTNLLPNFVSKASAVISSLVATFNLSSSLLSTIPRFFKSDTINSLTAASSVPTWPDKTSFASLLATIFSAIISGAISTLVAKPAVSKVLFTSLSFRFVFNLSLNPAVVTTSAVFANPALDSAVFTLESSTLSVVITFFSDNFLSRLSVVMALFAKLLTTSVVATFSVSLLSFDTIPRFFKSDTIKSLTASSSVPTWPYKTSFASLLATIFSAMTSGLTSVFVATFKLPLPSTKPASISLFSIWPETVELKFWIELVCSCNSLTSLTKPEISDWTVVGKEFSIVVCLSNNSSIWRCSSANSFAVFAAAW